MPAVLPLLCLLAPGNLIGAGAINTVLEEAPYRKIRAIFDEQMATDAVMTRNLPEIQDKVNFYTDLWATLCQVPT